MAQIILKEVQCIYLKGWQCVKVKVQKGSSIFSIWLYLIRSRYFQKEKMVLNIDDSFRQYTKGLKPIVIRYKLYHKRSNTTHTQPLDTQVSHELSHWKATFKLIKQDQMITMVGSFLTNSSVLWDLSETIWKTRKEFLYKKLSMCWWSSDGSYID